jgi:hypothetical protein
VLTSFLFPYTSLMLEKDLLSLEVGDRLRDERGVKNVFVVLQKVEKGVIIGHLKDNGHHFLVTKWTLWAANLVKVD